MFEPWLNIFAMVKLGVLVNTKYPSCAENVSFYNFEPESDSLGCDRTNIIF